MKRRSKIIAVCLMMFILCQCSVFAQGMTRQDNGAAKDIVQLATENTQLSTLTKALQAADLTDTLKGAGPFTVFAPTNDAFAKLPQGTLDELLKPANKEKLKDLLTYHVAKGKVSSEEAARLNNKDVTMLNGKPARIEVKNNELYIDGAKVIVKDIQAKNGVIHIIDMVMMPS